MIIGLKDSILCDQVIFRNNNYRNYLNERRRNQLIFYLSEGALTRMGGGGGVIKAGPLIKFFSCRKGRSFEGAFILARALFQIITVMLPGLQISYLNALMPGSNCCKTHFISHSKFVCLNCLHPRNTKKRDKSLPIVQL